MHLYHFTDVCAGSSTAADGGRIVKDEMDQVGVEIINGAAEGVDSALSLVDPDRRSQGEFGWDGESREGGYVRYRGGYLGFQRRCSSLSLYSCRSPTDLCDTGRTASYRTVGR